MPDSLSGLNKNDHVAVMVELVINNGWVGCKHAWHRGKQGWVLNGKVENVGWALAWCMGVYANEKH